MEKEKSKYLKALGTRVKEIRIAKGLSQRQLAHNMGKDRQSMHRVEKGQVNPGYIWLLQLADALDVEMADLLKGLTTIQKT